VRIDAVAVYHASLPLLYPWRTAYGEDAAVGTILVRLESGGVCGWGEATPFERPEYSAEWAGGAFALVRDTLAPALVGAEVESGDDLQARLGRFKGNFFAKAALDTAWWSLEGKLRGRSLRELLGGTRTAVPVGADFGVMDSLDDLLDAVGGAVDAGFLRVKLKFCRGWEHVVFEVRRTFPDLTIHVDCNSGYTLADAGLFRKLDALGLAMIEQPLAHDDLVDHAKLQQCLDTPVCLDESIVTVRAAEHAIELGSCRYVNIKPGRVGGLTCARRIHDVCAAAGIPCWVGGNLETGVGASVAVALATLDNFVYPADIFPPGRFYRDEVARPLVEFRLDERGRPTAVACEVATGFPEPDPERLAHVSVETAWISGGDAAGSASMHGMEAIRNGS
jgi:O-succinylbenzoate synthase